MVPLSRTHIEQIERMPLKPVDAPLPAPAPASPMLGPLEQALSVLVEQAFARSMHKILEEQRVMHEKQMETLHTMMNAQHDSLMAYWDDDFKRSRMVQAEFIPESIAPARTQLEQVRVQRKRVLIVATNNQRGIQDAIERRFHGVDFTFADGSHKLNGAGSFYDLVLCNATNKPVVKEKLTDLHGLKVVFTDGGSNTMVEHIRKRLGI